MEECFENIKTNCWEYHTDMGDGVFSALLNLNNIIKNRNHKKQMFLRIVLKSNKISNEDVNLNA